MSKQLLSSDASLRTLYSLYAGVDQVSADAVDSWLETAATVLTNPTAGSSSLLVHLADALLDVGDVAAAHVCYICADHYPGLGNKSRIGLIGLNPARACNWALTTESIQMTEIYEYAKTLGGGGPFPVPGFHMQKLAYAAWLAELGHVLTAIEYCDALARVLRDTPVPVLRQHVSAGFVSRLADLYRRLCACDPAAAMNSTTGVFWREQCGGLIATLRFRGRQDIVQVPKVTELVSRVHFSNRTLLSCQTALIACYWLRPLVI